MNLRFGVLWIEDQKADGEEEELRRAAREHGFELRIESDVDGSSVGTWAIEHGRYCLFDLVLVDWDLEGETLGDEVAENVRKQFPATPILFYSAKAPNGHTELVDKIAARRVEGVFVSERQDFIRRAGEIIGNLAVSFNRLAGMRGLAARVVAEVDDHHRAILIHAGRNGLAAEIEADLRRRVEEGAAGTTEKLGKLEGFDALLASHLVTSQVLCNCVRNLTKAHREALGADTDKISALRRRTKPLGEAVLKKRNLLGHALEHQGPDGWIIQTPVGQEDLTVAEFPQLRRTFIEQLDHLAELRRLLVPGEPDEDAADGARE